MFQANSRVERKNGIRFYEQDVLCSDYIFAGDTVIDFTVDYRFPGIGILLVADNGKPLNDADDLYLFKLGDNDFRVIEKHYLSQSTPVEASCAFAASDANLNANLIFSKKGRNITLNLVTYNAITGARVLRELGHYTFKKDIGQFRIGFYSSAGNTLKSASIASGIPKNWAVNIKNTNGGRISFFKNGFMIEECERDAEIEQQEIALKAGTYYVSFEASPMDGRLDTKCYVFSSTSKVLDDDKKNILKDGKFTLKQDGMVNMKFKGTSGKISEIAIKDFENSSFVETDDQAVTQEGSYITVTLTHLKSFRWKGTIDALPVYEDYTKECPYAIMATNTQRITQEMANIDLGKEYKYEYTVATKELHITRDGDLDYKIKIDLQADDKNKLVIFQNMSAIITELIVVNDDGTETNVLLQKTFRKYVPGTISSPILITDVNKEPLDLSSSYREVVKPSWTIELFNQTRPIELKGKILNEGECMFVYGIPAGATINVNRKDSIEKFSDRYTLLSATKYSVNYQKGIIEINHKDRTLYKHIAVRYQLADKFTYLFTNYERELFTNTLGRIVLEKPVADVSGNMRIYGIPEGALVDDRYFYRVPDKTMFSSIDLYASKYDLISEADYDIDYKLPGVEVKAEIREKYKVFVIDYLKDDSYCINYLPDYGQYEVEICTTQDKVYMSYDMDESGGVSDYQITKIKPDKNKYIVLRPNKKEE